MTAHASRLKALALALLAACAFATPSAAQTPITMSFDSVFFADNGEFFSPFRTGETILGTWQRFNTDFQISDKATLRLGLFAIEHDGSEHRTDLARPVAALIMGTKRHRLIIGTLQTADGEQGMGPDRMTPHGVLPLFAVETRWFERAYEAGVQWKTHTEHVTQDMWFDYQKVITSKHRELFDGGFTGQLQSSEQSPVALLYQFQVVHHGGQQFDVGPVSDSFGWGPGLLVRKRLPGSGLASLEAYGLYSYDRPDRQIDALTVRGKGGLLRAAVEKNDWRGHAIVWSGKDFKHEDGDPNYLSLSYDAETYRQQRKYFEMGLARTFRPAPTVEFEASGRAHAVQGKWGYSYRMTGILHLGLWRSATKYATTQ